MKELTINDMYEIDKLLSQAEEKLRFTMLDDEMYLINNIRSYLRTKRNKIHTNTKK